MRIKYGFCEIENDNFSGDQKPKKVFTNKILYVRKNTTFVNKFS